MTFEEYIEKNLGHGTPKIENFAFDKDGNQLVTKIYLIESFTISELEKDINDFNGGKFDTLKLKKDLPKINTTKHKIYREYYTKPEMIEMVRRHFVKDIEIGKYKF